jgi:RNA polymerase sigma-70 factor (ECF subfamily)
VRRPSFVLNPSSPPASGLDPTAEARCRDWFEAHGSAVYNYFRFHAPVPDVAEDLTAETFLRVVTAAGTYDDKRGTAKAWILTVARNVLADWGRRARVRQYVALGSMRDLVCDAPSPEERLMKEEEVGQLLDVVATLAPADRELIGLRYGSGLDTAEMAQILGISEGNVRTRLWRVLGRLRRAIAR